MKIREIIYSNIIQGLAENNDEFYFQHKSGSLTVKIKFEEQ